MSHEKSKTVQIPNSDASLHISKNSVGLFMMQVLTDDPIYTNFNHIPKDECFVSPVVEVVHSSFNFRRPDIIHTLKIPHCLPEQDMWKSFKVRQWSGDEYRELRNFLPKKDIKKLSKFRQWSGDEHRGDEHRGDEHREGCFYVDEHFITIQTRTFSKFTCTVCKNVCQFRPHVFLCGELLFWKEPYETTVKIITYISTYLTSLKEFRKVGFVCLLDLSVT